MPEMFSEPRPNAATQPNPAEGEAGRPVEKAVGSEPFLPGPLCQEMGASGRESFELEPLGFSKN